MHFPFLGADTTSGSHLAKRLAARGFQVLPRIETLCEHFIYHYLYIIGEVFMFKNMIHRNYSGAINTSHYSQIHVVKENDTLSYLLISMDYRS